MWGRETELKALESELGLPDGFYARLRTDDDWSFIIKLHALFESATTFVLARCLRKPELEEAFAHVEMSNRRAGKVAFGKLLGLFDEEDRRFIYELSELRNTVVHRAANVSFSFEPYIAGLDSNQRDRFVSAFGFVLRDPIEVRELRIPRKQFVVENPKLTIWISGSAILAGLYQEKTIAEIEQRTDALMRQLLDATGKTMPEGAAGAL